MKKAPCGCESIRDKMAVLRFLPKIRRCCFCTNDLRLASVFIILFGMLTTTHGIAIVTRPTCRDLYRASSGPLKWPLLIIAWLVFLTDLGLLAASFVFLIGIFWKRPITADVFMIFVIVSCSFSLVYSILYIAQMISATCSNNPSDVLALFMYIGMWIYFLFVLNSYCEQMTED